MCSLWIVCIIIAQRAGFVYLWAHFAGGGVDGCGLNNPSGLLPRQAFGQRATVSRGRDRASVRKCPEQWGISKLANGKKPTRLFARKHLLAPYTGEAIVRMTPSAPSGHLPQTHPKKILRLFLGTPGREARGMTVASAIYSLSHDTEASFGCRDSSPEEAPTIRNKKRRCRVASPFLMEVLGMR